MTPRLSTATAAAALVMALVAFERQVAVQERPPAPASPKAAALERLAADPALRASLSEARVSPPAASDIIPGLLAVKVAGDMGWDALNTMAAAHGAERVTRPAFADFHLVTLAADADVFEAARALAAEPGVIYAEPVGRVRAFFQPNDPLYRFQWNLQQLEFDRVWDINPGGAGSVVVAVIDEGVAYKTINTSYLQAPDLAATTFVPGHDFIWDDDEPIDFGNHGTHVTGTIAQSTNNNLGVAGIAFNASIMPVKAISSDLDFLLGAPNLPTTTLVAQAIRFSADQGAKIINMSLGGPAPSTALRDALQYAVDQGALVVIAAGNSGTSGSPVQYPAAYAKDIEGVIAVAATDFSMVRAPYSNRNDYVELAAPGGNVDADANGDDLEDGILQQTIDLEAVILSGRFDRFAYLAFQGTSMATPHVSGVAALLYEQGIQNPKAIEAALKRFATDLGAAGRDDEYGYGLINPRATLRGLGLAR